MAIQTVGMVMAVVFALTILALLFSWINAQVKAYYSPKPYYSRRPKSQERSIWNRKRASDAFDNDYAFVRDPTFDDSSYHMGLGLRLDSDWMPDND